MTGIGQRWEEFGKLWHSLNGEKWIFFYIAPSAVIAALAVVLASYVLVKPPPVTAHLQPVIGSEALCPGDSLIYISDFEVRTPGIVMIVDTVVDVKTGRTEVFDFDPQWAVNTRPFASRRIASYPIPNLRPGAYEYRRGYHSEEGGMSIASIPFTIREGCR